MHAPTQIKLHGSIREAILSAGVGSLAASPASLWGAPGTAHDAGRAASRTDDATGPQVDVMSRMQEAIANECDRSGLNPSQRQVVLECSSIACDGIVQRVSPSDDDPASESSFRRVHLVQGPPGTGKTATVACLLRVLAALQSRTMVCAPTNVAVQVVAGRLLHATGLVGREDGSGGGSSGNGLGGKSVCSHRASNLVEGTRETWASWLKKELVSAGLDLLPVRHGLPCRLAEIVLVAAEDKVDVEGDMRFIYLTERVKRLEACVDLEHGFTATTQECAWLPERLEEGYRQQSSLDAEKSRQLAEHGALTVTGGGGSGAVGNIREWNRKPLSHGPCHGGYIFASGCMGS
eukprot:jgi/Mesvir1/6618/Mv12751-RA.1